VDVFTIQPVNKMAVDQSTWDAYLRDLTQMMSLFQSGQRREARGQLAKRVGAAFQAIPGNVSPLMPIDIEIENDPTQRYTILKIDAPDTFGFLYEFTNALAFTRTNINRMIVQSIGNRAQDVFFVTDANGNRIEDDLKRRELRASIVLIKHFTHLLPNSPNPEIALLHFREFLAHLFERPNWPDEIASIEQSDVLKALAHILGVSDFLWDDFLRMQYANLFPVVKDVGALAVAKPRIELNNELTQATETKIVGGIGYPDWQTALNAYKDRELFRIDMRHILGLTSEFWDFAAELTDLAEVVISASVDLCQADLGQRFGYPVSEDGKPGSLSVVALGKCGGRELGFASDIELMFIYSGDGHTDGGESIETADYYEKLVRSVVTTIHARQEGIFQIDLQLRPYGKAGSMAVSLEAFKKYFAPDGPAWAYERQALVKLRPIAGDMDLGLTITQLRDEFAYESGSFDVTAMRAMRERQIRHLVTGGTFNAKYSPGGLVDIEYLIQGLQINHGASNPALRVTNIRTAMALLNEAGILSEADYSGLRKSHTFLRWLIDSLRVVRGNAKDITVPPYGSEEFAFLARRLRYENDIDRLRDDLLMYQTQVQEINNRLLG
jgi:glutamate-ammonia-ligase adenylyltransferase